MYVYDLRKGKWNYKTFCQREVKSDEKNRFLKTQRRAKRKTEAAFGRCSESNCCASACKNF